MDIKQKIEAFYSKQQPFKDGINALRAITLKTELEETLKWNSPIYTINNKNVLGIMAFKNHFGLWFFNGSYLKDANNVLENTQENKTKFMRHWKFSNISEVNKILVEQYIREAIENERNGIFIKPRKAKKKLEIPVQLLNALNNNNILKEKFESLTPYKQKEYVEYISSAKQEKTKLTRLAKSIDLISNNKGLNDQYRK